MNDIWIEAKSPTTGVTQELYAIADAQVCKSIHHFFEPWYPDGAVVRILVDENLDAVAGAIGDRAAWSIWDSTGDERLFGENWPLVRSFFEAASRLALVSKPDDWGHRKLVHCAMNSWGFERNDEIRFALRIAYGHARIIVHCKTWKWLRRKGGCRYGCHNAKWAA